MSVRISETPKDEMARLIRVIAGPRQAGETEELLRTRAARRMGISTSRAKTLWYAESDNIRSDEMDTARDLAAVQPLENLADAIEACEQYLETLALDGCLTLADRVLAGLQGRFAARLAGRGLPAHRAGGADPVRHRRRASDRIEGGAAGAALPSSPLNPRSSLAGARPRALVD